MPVAISVSEILSIPTGKILPNPKQPRRFISAESIQAMKASLLAIGQETPLKVRPLTSVEKVQYPGFEYLLLGGHRRLEGAKAAGIDTLQALVVKITPEATKLASLMDNQSEDMHWLDWDLAVQELYGDGKTVSQQELADQLGVSQEQVSRAVKVAKALTPTARELIYAQCIKDGSDNQVSERTVRALTALTDPTLVEKALPVVLDRHLTEAQTKKLVEWVKGSNEPESFDADSHTESVLPKHGSRLVALTQATSPHTGVGKPKGDGIRNEENTDPSTPNPSPNAQSAPSSSSKSQEAGSSMEPAHPKHGGQKMLQAMKTLPPLIAAEYAWGKVSQMPQQFLSRAFPGILRKFYFVVSLIEKLGIKNKGWATLITFFLCMFAASFLIGKATHFLGRLASRIALSRLEKSYPSAASSPQNSSKPTVEGDHSQEALHFAKDFYSADHGNTTYWMNDIQDQLAKDYAVAFFRDFCPPTRISEIQERKLREEFYSTSPVQFLGGDGYLVQGKAVLKSDLSHYDQTLTEGPVELEVHVVRKEGDPEDGKIAMVKERLGITTPSFTTETRSSRRNDTAKERSAHKPPTAQAGSSTLKASATDKAKGDLLTKAVSVATDEAAKKTGEDLGTKAGDVAKKLFGL